MTFSASDPTGGAGMQADIMTLAALDCHPLTVLTGITVQDSSHVYRLDPLLGDLVKAQAQTLLDDMPAIAAFKCGVLASTENVRIVADIARQNPHVPLVVDPILTSGRGDILSAPAVRAELLSELFPLATLITPNCQELRELTQANPQLTSAQCASRLLRTGCRYILLTGKQKENTIVNRLYSPAGLLRSDDWPLLQGDYHGSGCTLATAISALLARQLRVEDAVFQAQWYVQQYLRHAQRPGSGQWIPKRRPLTFAGH